MDWNTARRKMRSFRAGKIKPIYIRPVVLNNIPLKVVEKGEIFW